MSATRVKRSLLEGGVRVPGIVEWPGHVTAGARTDVVACTSDYLPTVLDAVGLAMPDARPLHGISLMPLLAGEMRARPRPIAFESGRQLALIGQRYKIVRAEPPPRNAAATSRVAVSQFALFDLTVDPGEVDSLAAAQAEPRAEMFATLEAWRLSCARSRGGADYGR